MSDTLPQVTLAEIWRRMTAIYGHRWTSAYTDDPTSATAATWGAGLAGLLGAQLAAGFRAIVASGEGWPPSLPEFRALCLGIPSLASVRHEFRRGAEKSPFARLVWSNLDTFRWRQASSENSERMEREAYEIAREHVMRGGALPEPSPALAAPEEAPAKPSSPEAFAAAREAYNKLYGRGSSESEPEAPTDA